MTRNRFLSLAVSFCLVTAAANATTIRRVSLNEVRDRAEAIFIGRVVSSSVRPVVNGTMQATDYLIEVSEVLYGRVFATTTVTYFGGPARPNDAAPALEADREYVFFRTGQPGNTTVGWRQGLFRIETANVSGTARQVLVSADGEPLVMRNGALARGSRVAVEGRKIVPLVSSDAVVQQRVAGVATNADGTPATAVQPIAAAAAPVAAFATLDDLREFVRQRAAVR